jgi:hypothetical protein
VVLYPQWQQDMGYGSLDRGSDLFIILNQKTSLTVPHLADQGINAVPKFACKIGSINQPHTFSEIMERDNVSLSLDFSKAYRNMDQNSYRDSSKETFGFELLRSHVASVFNYISNLSRHFVDSLLAKKGVYSATQDPMLMRIADGS